MDNKDLNSTIPKYDVKNTMDGLNIGIIIVDIELNIIYANPKSGDILNFYEISNLSEYDDIYKYYDPITNNELNLNDLPLSITLKTGEPVKNFLMMVKNKKNGMETYVNTNSYLVNKKDGKRIAAVEIEDVTETFLNKKLISELTSKLDELTNIIKRTLTE